jgi:hypothetical protein
MLDKYSLRARLGAGEWRALSPLWGLVFYSCTYPRTCVLGYCQSPLWGFVGEGAAHSRGCAALDPGAPGLRTLAPTGRNHRPRMAGALCVAGFEVPLAHKPEAYAPRAHGPTADAPIRQRSTCLGFDRRPGIR